MKVKLTKADMNAAHVEVRNWRELCSSFGFRIEVPASAEEKLIEIFAYLFAQKTTDSLVGRLRHGATASLIVAFWMHDSAQRNCEVWLSKNAHGMLVGTFIDPLARTGFPPGRMPTYVGRAAPGFAKFKI